MLPSQALIPALIGCSADNGVHAARVSAMLVVSSLTWLPTRQAEMSEDGGHSDEDEDDEAGGDDHDGLLVGPLPPTHPQGTFFMRTCRSHVRCTMIALSEQPMLLVEMSCQDLPRRDKKLIWHCL